MTHSPTPTPPSPSPSPPDLRPPIRPLSPLPIRSPESRRQRRLLWLLALSLALFAALSADVLAHGLLWHFDRWLAAANYRQGWNKIALWIGAALTQFGSLNWVAFVAISGSLLLLVRKRYRECLLWLVAFLGAAFITPVVKDLFHLPRPYATSYFSMEVRGYTFPSGHTFGATTLFGISAYMLGRTVPRWRHSLVFAAAAGSCVVAASLVFVGVHYLSDVLAAQALCLVWLITCIHAGERLLRLPPPHSPPAA